MQEHVLESSLLQGSRYATWIKAFPLTNPIYMTHFIMAAHQLRITPKQAYCPYISLLQRAQYAPFELLPMLRCNVS